jgi:predicted Abi (CAAX) family protease
VSIRSFAVQRAADLQGALTAIPDARSWLACSLVFVIFVACAGPIGLASGLLSPTTPHLTIERIFSTAAIVFIQPALLEEVVFRGLLLPRNPRSVSRPRLVSVAVVALALYVVSHPINAMLFRPGALHVFANPVYLVLATLLGIACTAAYFISKSLWPPVAIHWAAVLIWLWFLGGERLLTAAT